MKVQIEQDLKTAMLAGDKTLVTTLRGIKSAILYAEVASNKRDEGLSDQEMVDILRKELKKRQESADLYAQGGNQERQEAELTEAKVIEKYLPQQLPDEELNKLVDEAISEIGPASQQTMGQLIGKVKALSGGSVDGSRIATAVKGRME